MTNNPNHVYRPAHRSLNKTDLGGVIFGCTNDTKEECLSKQLFGLPFGHVSYVKNIEPGLPLFLFNYTDRKLHGIFEAASCGQMNIDPYAWSKDGSGKTTFPAQVQIRTRLRCQPLPEDQFKSVITNNYYRNNHFLFELDHAQASKLVSMFSSRVLTVVPKYLPKARKLSFTQPKSRPDEMGEATVPPVLELDSSVCQDGDCESCLGHQGDGEDLIYQQLLKLAMESDSSRVSHGRETNSTSEIVVGDGPDGRCKTDEAFEVEDVRSSSHISQLLKEVGELKTFKDEQTFKMSLMEQKLIEAEADIQRLKKHCNMLQPSSDQYESLTAMEEAESWTDQCMNSDAIFVAGGYNGQTWLSSASFFSLSRDIVKHLRPMLSTRAYASLAKLNDKYYVVGGGLESQWYDTVESYNPVNDEWVSQPNLKVAKGSLATVTINDKIFAMGGADGLACFSDMEMLDLDVGRWIPTRSMLQKRFALGAVQLNDAIYAVGGYDGVDYLSTVERFDPREHEWKKIEGMNSKRGCHSLVVLNEKIYALGGYNGSDMASSVEVYDPRLGKWTLEGSMNHARGYASAAVLNDAIYILGGLLGDDSVAESAERYEEGKGWQETKLKALGKRCFASAVAL